MRRSGGGSRVLCIGIASVHLREFGREKYAIIEINGLKFWK